MCKFLETLSVSLDFLGPPNWRFLERGLFVCENSFHSSFQLLSQDFLLDYAWRENRSFYLLLLRHMQHMIQRRCFFTALQLAKVIFSKDPIHDPLAILLVIDSLALKAKEYQWFIDFYLYFKVFFY